MQLLLLTLKNSARGYRSVDHLLKPRHPIADQFNSKVPCFSQAKSSSCSELNLFKHFRRRCDSKSSDLDRPSFVCSRCFRWSGYGSGSTKGARNQVVLRTRTSEVVAGLSSANQEPDFLTNERHPVFSRKHRKQCRAEDIRSLLCLG